MDRNREEDRDRRNVILISCPKFIDVNLSQGGVSNYKFNYNLISDHLENSFDRRNEGEVSFPGITGQ